MLMLSELIERERLDLPQLDAHAMVHLHCNHRAVMDVEAELAVIRRVFVSHEIPEPGCCGMAGPFGFDAHKYDVSMKIGEQALLPAARSAAQRTWVIANGFSCREQLLQGAGRESAHLAEAIWYAMNKE
jgi:Fe-S oxidoreductase